MTAIASHASLRTGRNARTARFLMILSAALVAAASPLAAQVTPEIKTRLDAIGRRVDTLATGAIYTPLQTKAASTDFRIEREIKYGADPKQALDVVAPPPTGGALPVLIMIHGGGFVAGDKTRDEKRPIQCILRQYHAVGCNKRHGGGQRQLPARAGLHISRGATGPRRDRTLGPAEYRAPYGGDPRQIYMMGHSAGAAHVASYVANPQYGPGGETGLAKAVFSSGSYEFTSPHAYFGDEAASRSSIAGLVDTKLPYMVIVAENDPPPFHVQAGKTDGCRVRNWQLPPVSDAQGSQSHVRRLQYQFRRYVDEWTYRCISQTISERC